MKWMKGLGTGKPTSNKQARRIQREALGVYAPEESKSGMKVSSRAKFENRDCNQTENERAAPYFLLSVGRSILYVSFRTLKDRTVVALVGESQLKSQLKSS